MCVSKARLDYPVRIDHERRVRVRLDHHVHPVKHVLVLPLVRAALAPRARDARARAVREAALDVDGGHRMHVVPAGWAGAAKFMRGVCFSKRGLCSCLHSARLSFCS